MFNSARALSDANKIEEKLRQAKQIGYITQKQSEHERYIETTKNERAAIKIANNSLWIAIASLIVAIIGLFL